MDRASFLDRLRERVANVVPPNLAHPLDANVGPTEVRYDVALEDPVACFCEQARVAGAVVELTENAPAFVRGVIEEIGATKLVCSTDPEVEKVKAALGSFDVLPFDIPRPEADLGVVGAAWGIAATGTVAFEAGRAGGRTASLLPPAIVVLLRVDRILARAADLFSLMRDELPSQLVLCTGPSKSGDIELELTTGVHGPGRVWIGVLG